MSHLRLALRSSQRRRPPSLPNRPNPNSTRQDSTIKTAWQTNAEGKVEKNAEPDRSDAITVEIKPIGEVKTNIRLPAKGLRPEDLAKPIFEKEGHTQAVVVGSYHGYLDAARVSDLPEYDFYQHPLYFEDANLERCGLDHGILQPAISGTYFFGTIPLLPYKMVVQPPKECVWSLGDCPPCYGYTWYENYLPPLRTNAALVEAGFIVGLILLIP